MRRTLTVIAIVLVVLALGSSVAAQNPPAANAPAKVVIVAPKLVDSVEGAKLFEAYCVSCHGRDGKGNGPASHLLPTPVPDLTQIAATHATSNCFRHVLAELQRSHQTNGEPIVSEKNLAMPNWGQIFRAMSSQDPNIGYLRARNVATYVASIQTVR